MRRLTLESFIKVYLAHLRFFVFGEDLQCIVGISIEGDLEEVLKICNVEWIWNFHNLKSLLI